MIVLVELNYLVILLMSIALPALSHQWSVLGGQSVEAENEPLIRDDPICVQVLYNAAVVAAHEC